MRLIDADALRAEYQAILDRGDMFCEYDIVGMVDNAPTVERKPFATVTFNKDELERIVDERVIEPIKNGELVIKEERPHGEWLKSDVPESILAKCSICGFDCGAYTHNFCPNCGADMKKEEEDADN